QYTYEPFGTTTVMGTGSNNTFEYTGRENDGTGLYYYRARHYHPTSGRFISEDPVGFDAGMNFYAYVQNKPVLLIDPFGLPSMLFNRCNGTLTLYHKPGHSVCSALRV